ncbi:VOC family protein [Chryseobacterium proteolyticum]|uniref:VOC family protein n=1 Tax=Chryseobacterium proteolyticum TaxID=118127 RepID=UPI0039838071
MEIQNIDHIVLTVADIEKTISFYTDILGFEAVSFGDNRKALAFGNQKINLHQKGNEFEPKALHATPGSADLCFIATTDVHDILKELKEKKHRNHRGYCYQNRSNRQNKVRLLPGS